MQYSSFIGDLQHDSDEEHNTESDVAVEFPGQENSSYFKKFGIKFRNIDSKDCSA